MAFGFLGFSNKTGPGVDKERPEKRRFFLFFELYFRKFSKMVLTSLLYSLFLVPSIALTVLGFMFFPAAPFDLIGLTLGLALIGPPTCGLVFLLRQMSLERPVFIWHDFWDAFKKNFKQSLIFSVLDAVIIFFIATSLRFAVSMFSEGVMQYVILVVYLAIAIIVAMAHYYAYLLMVTLDLRISQIIKNSLILAISALKTNLVTTVFMAILIVAPVVFLEPVLLTLIALVLLPLFYPALVGFIIVFNSFPHIKRLLIDPYYETHPQERKNNPFGDVWEDEEEEAVFTDLGTLEPKSAAASGPKVEHQTGGRTIS